MINKANTTSIKNQRTNIGVLTDSEVLLISVVQGRRVLRSILLPPHGSELSRLLEQLWEVRLTEVWVMPGTNLSRNATCGWLEQVDDHWVVVVHSDPHEPTRPVSALLWPKGGGQREAGRLTFVFPEHAGWDWVLPDARTLLATVTYLDSVLGKPLTNSPDLIARQFLLDLTREQPISLLRPSSTGLGALSTNEGTAIPLIESARDLAWMRPLTRVEQRQRYLHKYTHLSLYLEACMAVSLGAGTAEYSSNGRACDDIRPGLWRVSAEFAGSIFDGKQLPICIDGEWMSTPQVKCCRDIGYFVQVREGYYWPQSSEPLKAWATTLWQAGERLYTSQLYRQAQGRTNASSTLKLLAQRGVEVLAQEQAAGGWGRPDWWAQVVGRSRAALFAHLVRLARKGTMPVLVDRDALWVVSDDHDPLTAVPGLVNASRWRGYSVGYQVPLPLSREVREVFRTTADADQAASMLDALADETFS